MAPPFILSQKPKPAVRAERCETCTSGHFIDGIESGECRLDPPKGQFVPVMQANLTLSFDHRVMDGGAAGRLLTRISELLAHPEKL